LPSGVLPVDIPGGRRFGACPYSIKPSAKIARVKNIISSGDEMIPIVIDTH
jgi:hypothetical protein